MRSIERVRRERVRTEDSVDNAAVEVAEQDPFDALSNALDDVHFAQFDDDELKQSELGDDLKECNAILHEIESLIENREGPEVPVQMAAGPALPMLEEVEGSAPSKTEVVLGMAVPSECAPGTTTATSAVTSAMTVQQVSSALLQCVQCQGDIEGQDDLLMVNGKAMHCACFVCNGCAANLVNQPYLELAEGTAGNVQLCQHCVSQRFLKVQPHAVAVPNP